MTYLLEIQLFKNAYSDNHNRIKKFVDLTAQNTYYNGLSDKKEINGTFNKIGENIVINGQYTDFIPYNYGRFKYQNTWFYFSVVEYLVLNESKLSIVYTLDYYETARYQFDMNLGKGLIQNITTEYSAGKIAKMPKMDNGLGIRKFVSNSTMRYMGVAFYVFHNESRRDINGIYVYRCPSNSGPDLASFHSMVLDGYISTALLTYLRTLESTIDYNDIKGAWLIPSKITDIIDTSHKWVNVATNLWKHDNASQTLYDDFTYSESIEIKRTDKEYTVFSDNTRSIMWECPTGAYYNGNKNIQYTLDISASSCELKIKVWMATSSLETIVYPLPPITIYNNAFLEYSARQRQTDIQLRHTNNDQQLVNSLVNLGASSVGGGVGGAIAGGKTGAGLGAGATFISGFIGAVGSYQVNEYYGNIQQSIVDKQYRHAVSNLLLHGDSLLFLLEGGGFGFNTVSYDGDLGGDRVDKTIQTYGYEINLNYPDVQTYIDYIQTTNDESYIMGNFEINGHIPDNWKVQIKNRFNGGVTFGI